MKQNQVSAEVISSYKTFEENLWDEFEGNDEEQILKGLPRMLRFEVRSKFLHDIIHFWPPLHHESQGVIFSMLHQLKTVVYPSQEFVF